MTLSFAFFAFLNALWIMAFIAIPFSVEYEEKPEDFPANERYIAAPKTIHWKKAIKIAATLAALVTLALKLIIDWNK